MFHLWPDLIKAAQTASIELNLSTQRLGTAAEKLEPDRKKTRAAFSQLGEQDQNTERRCWSAGCGLMLFVALKATGLVSSDQLAAPVRSSYLHQQLEAN